MLRWFMCDEQLSVGNSLSQSQKRGHTIQLFVLPSAGIIQLAVCKHKTGAGIIQLAVCKHKTGLLYYMEIISCWSTIGQNVPQSYSFG